MPKLYNSNPTFWVIFKQCEEAHIARHECMSLYDAKCSKMVLKVSFEKKKKHCSLSPWGFSCFKDKEEAKAVKI